MSDTLTDTCITFPFTSARSHLLALLAMPVATRTEKLVVNLDSHGHCYGQDFCWCLGNGLVPGGVLEFYCKALYANSSGLPLDDSTACKV